MLVFAFDVYGTLVNPLGVKDQLVGLGEEKARDFAAQWRLKQLEYSFRRGLMEAYCPFDQVTREALFTTNTQFEVPLGEKDIELVMQKYVQLPAFDSAKPTLEKLSGKQHRLFAFSNGTKHDVTQLLSHAGLLDHLEGVISVDDVKCFKPSPTVYQHFCAQTGSTPENTVLVSGNGFDILGAHHCGWRTVWINQDAKLAGDLWGVEPDFTISALGEIVELPVSPSS